MRTGGQGALLWEGAATPRSRRTSRHAHLRREEPPLVQVAAQPEGGERVVGVGSGSAGVSVACNAMQVQDTRADKTVLRSPSPPPRKM